MSLTLFTIPLISKPTLSKVSVSKSNQMYFFRNHFMMKSSQNCSISHNHLIIQYSKLKKFCSTLEHCHFIYSLKQSVFVTQENLYNRQNRENIFNTLKCCVGCFVFNFLHKSNLTFSGLMETKLPYFLSTKGL